LVRKPCALQSKVSDGRRQKGRLAETKGKTGCWDAPLVEGEIVVQARFDVLECVELSKHVEHLGQRQLSGLGDETLELLWVGKLLHLHTKLRNGGVLKGVKVLELLNLRGQDLNGFLVNLFTVSLVVALDLYNST
jgi:hypothetical protein